MGAAYFYHLSERPLEATLPVLLEKSLAAGWRVAVRGTDPARLEWLDRALWQGDGFLPHGLAGGPQDEDQPVLLTTAPEVPNGARCLMAVDGAGVTAEEVSKMERVCVLFDGANDEALEAARDLWRTLTGAGAVAQYWAEADGRWSKKAESGV
jgi:DNA polymerase-3 subunit chi